MKFHWENGLLQISVQLYYDNKEYNIDNCILDTGSAGTAFDIDLIEFNYKKPTLIRKIRGIGGDQEVATQQIDTLFLDSFALEKIDVEFGNFTNRFGINGFIGINALSHFQTTISFSKKSIEFQRET